MADSSVRLAGRLPDGDKNGLASIAHLLVDDPSAVHVAIVLLDCSRLTTSVDDGATLPTARIRAIEPIREGPDAVELRRLHRRALEDRTGRVTLPLDLERELDDLGLHADDDDAPREPDARERAAGGDRDPLAPSPDTPLPARDPLAPPADEPVAEPDPLAPSPDAALEPERPLPGTAFDPTIDAPDLPDPADELTADDPRRITGGPGLGGLFREAPGPEGVDPS
jgi:hypothetical protein